MNFSYFKLAFIWGLFLLLGACSHQQANLESASLGEELGASSSEEFSASVSESSPAAESSQEVASQDESLAATSELSESSSSEAAPQEVVAEAPSESSEASLVSHSEESESSDSMTLSHQEQQELALVQQAAAVQESAQAEKSEPENAPEASVEVAAASVPAVTVPEMKPTAVRELAKAPSTKSEGFVPKAAPVKRVAKDAVQAKAQAPKAKLVAQAVPVPSQEATEVASPESAVRAPASQVKTANPNTRPPMIDEEEAPPQNWNNQESSAKQKEQPRFASVEIANFVAQNLILVGLLCVCGLIAFGIIVSRRAKSSEGSGGDL